MVAACIAASCGMRFPKGTPSDKAAVTSEYEACPEVNPFTWIATDGQGNEIDPDLSGYRTSTGREEKQVGIFYFVWHGCHGYDYGTNHDHVVPPTDKDKYSPFDIQKIQDADPAHKDNPKLGGQGVMHHWGEPELGYYVSDDEWVIRKHAQMLTDAGVDVIFFDATNGLAYLPVVKNIARIYAEIRKEGNSTPQFAFMLAGNSAGVLDQIYEGIYSKKLYKDLWYFWEGKPLVLCEKEDISDKKLLSYFTFRHSWFLFNVKEADGWYENEHGEDKWPWGGLYPQKPGMHQGKIESVAVMPATHPNANIGRSCTPEGNKEPKEFDSGKGIYFKGQFSKAMEYDPTMMFFTGWNEWTAQKQIARRDNESYFLDKGLTKKGDWYFVDQYNHEFSRDIEPLHGDFGDNYYYMMVDFIRKFKGTLQLPVYSSANSISIDGSFGDWETVEALYGDYRGDITHRNHYGWGSVGTYTNTTGRNDIVLSKVTNDGKNIYFYAECADDITPSTDPQWMQLFLHVDGTTSWESFDYAINRTKPGETEAVLEKSEGGWSWASAGKVSYKVAGNKIEISVPLESIGIKSADKFTVDFKWIDNAAGDGNIQSCMHDGDSAPDGRFRYRYKFSK